MSDSLSQPKLAFNSVDEPKADPLITQPIPQIFQGGENILVNYSYVDFLNQTGYKGFYPTNIASGSIWIVVPDTTLYAETQIKNYGEINIPAAFGLLYNDTIDLTFNVPKNVKGDIFINLPVGAVNEGSGSGITLKISGAIYYYNGTTTTQLGNTMQTDLPTYTGALNVADVRMCTLRFTVNNTQHFKAGEILRLKYTIYGKIAAGAQNGYISVGCDPSNSSYTANSLYYPATGITRQQWLVPFKLDI